MNELELYIRSNPNEFLDVGQTTSGKWYVRPMNWAGIWKDIKLFSGNCLAYFDTLEELETKLVELGCFERRG